MLLEAAASAFAFAQGRPAAVVLADGGAALEPVERLGDAASRRMGRPHIFLCRCTLRMFPFAWFRRQNGLTRYLHHEVLERATSNVPP
jgi:hypothetical protein